MPIPTELSRLQGKEARKRKPVTGIQLRPPPWISGDNGRGIPAPPQILPLPPSLSLCATCDHQGGLQRFGGGGDTLSRRVDSAGKLVAVDKGEAGGGGGEGWHHWFVALCL